MSGEVDMTDRRTMAKRQSLSIAGFALIAIFLLIPIVNTADGPGVMPVVPRVLLVISAIVFSCFALGAAWMYWRDWYRS